MGKISIKSMAMATGLTWGLGVFFLGVASVYGFGVQFVNVLSSIYLGYSPTFAGAVIGGIIALFDGGAAGAIIAYLYNHFLNSK